MIGGGQLGNEPALGGDEAAVEGEEGPIEDEKMDEFRDDGDDDNDSFPEKAGDVENGSNSPGSAFRAT